MENLPPEIKIEECCNQDCEQGRRCPVRLERRRINRAKRQARNEKIKEWIIDVFQHFSLK